MTGTRRDVLRLGVAAAACSPPGLRAQQQQGFISRKLNAPVPGGVAVLALGDARRRRRSRSWSGARWSCARKGVSGSPWWAFPVGQGGRAACVHRRRQGARELAFTVRPKEYAAQRITLKNPRQVNPSDEDMKRIEREMAEQSAANRSYRAGVTPSNLILDRPVPGGRLSSLRLRRIFNGEERNPHSGLDFASLPARRSRRRPLAW